MLNDDEESVARLIRLTGARPTVPIESQERVRQAVKAHWQHANRRRSVIRRATTIAALLGAAAVSVVGVRLWTARDTGVSTTPAARIVATVERVDRHASHLPGQGIHAGAALETPADGRMALRLADRTSLRLDTSTRVRFVDAVEATTLELAGGAVYIDTGAASTGVEVRTPLGIVRDVGTQFEVRMMPSALRISVRTGRVEVRGGAEAGGQRRSVDPVSVAPGTQLTVSDQGSATSVIPASGSLWSWTESLSPPFEIEGKPLASFLEHLGREHGWTIRYQDAQLARDASGIILHGSVAGLGPTDALAVAVRTSGLSHRLREGEVVISR